MKIFTSINTSAHDLVHLLGNKDNYVITENNGIITYESISLDRKYIINGTEELRFKHLNSQGKSHFKWDEEIIPFASTLNIHDIFKDGSAIATYNFNNNINDLNNVYNYSGDPTSIAGISYTEGNFDTCLTRDGSSENNIYSFPDYEGALGGINNFTVSVWMYIPTWFSNKAAIRFKNGTDFRFQLGQNSSDAYIGHYDGSTWYQGNRFNPNYGNWNHYVVVREGTILKLYENKILVSSTNVPVSLNNSYAKNGFIQDDSDTSGADGSIDQLRLFNKAVNQEEINMLFAEQ